MSAPPDHDSSIGVVRLRYWAAARAAAGTDCDLIEVPEPLCLADLVSRACDRHADSPRFSSVIACCAVMVGDRPVTTGDPASVMVPPGATVEFLPPFAGG